MAKILVFNNDTDRMETYYRGEAEPMPYNTNATLRVREFRGSSKSNVLWTTKRTMQSWNSQRYIFGAPIPVGFAFKRPYEGRTPETKVNIMLAWHLMLAKHSHLRKEQGYGKRQTIQEYGVT